jgi:hypothetical protein
MTGECCDECEKEYMPYGNIIDVKIADLESGEVLLEVGTYEGTVSHGMENWSLDRVRALRRIAYLILNNIKKEDWRFEKEWVQ